jgi:hypothetical protein
MSWISTMTQRLRGVNRFARVALAAEAADRVLSVHEKDWYGNPSPDVARGIEIAWAFACGNVVDQTEVAACRAELEGVMDYYNDESIAHVAESVTASLRALESMSADEQESCLAAARALMTGQAVAAFCEGDVLEEKPAQRKKGSAGAEEEDWQLKAVTLAEGWKGVARKNMFVPLNDKPPKWLVEWEEYIAERHAASGRTDA